MPLVSLTEAEEIVRSGELLVFPTETVFGIGCDPHSEAAVMQLLARKDRASTAGMPLLLSDPEELELIVADSTETHLQQRRGLQERHWPGALTLVVNVHNAGKLAPGVSAADGSLALRFSPLPATQRLAKACGGMVIATSANCKGQAPAVTTEEALAYFPDLAVLGLDSAKGMARVASTIVDVRCVPYRVIRAGAIVL